MAWCCRRRRRNRSRFPFVIQIGQMPQISRYLPLPILLPLLCLFSIKFESQHASYNLSAFSVILADHLSIISKRNLHTQNFRTQNLHTRSDLRIPTVPETRVLISSLARRDISIDSLCENLPRRRKKIKQGSPLKGKQEQSRGVTEGRGLGRVVQKPTNR